MNDANENEKTKTKGPLQIPKDSPAPLDAPSDPPPIDPDPPVVVKHKGSSRKMGDRVNIVVRVNEHGLDKCLNLMRQAVGEEAPDIQSLDQRFDDLLRLSRLISDRYGFVAFNHDEDRFPANGAGITRIVPIPTDALRNHCAALKAGTSHRVVGEIGHGG